MVLSLEAKVMTAYVPLPLAAWVLQEEERSRLTREAMADVDTGLFIDHEAVLTWSSSLNTDNPLVAPQVSPKT
jgi:predicted transcriptional regulator